MNRRGFLAGLIALPAVSYFLPPVSGWPRFDGFTTDNLRFKSTERFSAAFTDWKGVIGSSADGVALNSACHPPIGTVMGAVLRPGLEKFWVEHYDKHSEEWAELYGANEQLTLFADLDPNSLEEIEIELARPADAIGRTGGLLQTQRVAIADALTGRSYQSERAGGIFVPRLPRFRKEDPR
jgi:hypothetical protein